MSSSWHTPAAPPTLGATVHLPGSKSLTNRYLVLAALATGTSRLRAPLRSRDSLLMADALRALGTGIEDATSSLGGASPDWLITPATLRGDARIDAGLAGTVMRFVPPMAALANGPVHFDGDEQARVRPMGPMLRAMRDLGVTIEDEGREALPFTVAGQGAVRGGQVEVDASSSSQFISALLLSGARYEQGITIVHTGAQVPSQPHIDMTVEALRDAGAIVDDSTPNTWRVEPGPLNALDVTIEPDLSNAAAFLAAALVVGGQVLIPHWPMHTTQAGDRIRAILEAMGGQVNLGREGLTVTGTGEVTGIDIDLHEASELTPVVAALAALATSPSTIRGVAHIRGHETDRLAALQTELSALGAQVEERDDGLVISPSPLSAQPTLPWGTYADHRMVMAGAIMGLRVPGLRVSDPATVSKTLPGFTAMWEEMVETPQEGAVPAAGAGRASS